MTDSSIDKFRELLTFAINLETIVMEFYEGMRSETAAILEGDEISDRISDGDNRRKSLERARRNVQYDIEFDLDAVPDTNVYVIDSHPTNKAGIKSLHKNAAQFYEDVSLILESSGARGLFRRYDKAHTRLQHSLRI